MSSGEDVSYECSHYREEEKDHSDISCFLVQVGAVVQASSDVEVDADEKERGAISVHVSDEPAVINVSTNVGDR